jgi:beta-catenin-like protein 1
VLFAVCGLKVLKYAVTNNKQNCIKLIEVGGLKHIFPVLMGRGVPKDERTEAETAVVSIISQLCTHLHDVKENDCVARLLIKFTENDCEKLERCIEIFASYYRTLQETDKRIQTTVRALESADDDEELEIYSASIPSLVSRSCPSICCCIFFIHCLLSNVTEN